MRQFSGVVIRRVAAHGSSTALCAAQLWYTRHAVPHTLPVMCCQRRWLSEKDAGSADRPTASSGSSGFSASRTAPLLGVVELTAKNITAEMDSKVPLFLYFMVTNHPEVRSYTEVVAHQVDQANRRLKHENMGEVYGEVGKDAGLAIKLGLIDCLKEPGLTQKFSVDPHMFPLMYFVRNKVFCDKLVGIVTESQVKEAVEAFIEFGRTESQSEKEGTSIFQKIKRQDNDDENAMTLVAAAHGKLQAGDAHKAKELFAKSLNMSLDEIKVVNQRYGVQGKKMTRDLWLKLKREPCYNTAPEALCGLAMCATAAKNNEEAYRLAARVREEYPFAVQDMRGVAEAVVRIELMQLAGFDPEKDNYMSLLKYDELTSDPVAFYDHHLRRAVSFYVEGVSGQAIQECLRLIRAEPKLLPALKEAGVFPKDLQLGPSAETKARVVIKKIFEALGPTNEQVEKGRKMLQVYL